MPLFKFITVPHARAILVGILLFGSLIGSAPVQARTVLAVAGDVPLSGSKGNPNTVTTPLGNSKGNPNPDTSSNTDGQTLVNPLKSINSLPDLLKAVLDALVQLGSVVLVLALTFTGFKFVAARGNPTEIAKARTALMYTLIGGLILLGAKGISEVVQTTVSGL